MEQIKKWYPLVLFIGFVIVSVFLFQTCRTLKDERAANKFQQELNEQNQRANTAKIIEEFNKKLNAVEFSKQTYVTEKFAELEKYNKSLYAELSKVKGDILNAIKTTAEAKVPNMSLGNKLEVLDKDSGHYGLRWSSNYADSGFSQKISGSSRFYVNLEEKLKQWTINVRPDSTLLDTNLTTLKVTYGTRSLKRDGVAGFEVFAISRSPIVKITDMQGAYFVENQIVKPTKAKPWAIGPYIGFGLNTDYNLANPRFGWSMGFSVHYDVFQWRFGKK